jgi:flagellar hook-associated protein 2
MTTSATATTDPKWVDSVDAAKRASDFVDAYNDTLQTVQGMVTERKVPNATGNDRLKGLFSNSSTLTTIEDGLRNALGGIVNGLAPGKNLSKFAGIGTAPPKGAFDAGALDGKLTFDATAFQAMFSTDRDGLRDLLGKTGATAADNGIAARVADLTAAYTAESAYTTSAGATQVVSGGGVVTAAIKGSKDLFTDIQTRIDDMTARLALREQTLKNQFLAMETAISQLKSAGAELTSKLGSLTG